MKDELLRILNIKLKYLIDNIDALNRMNANLERENEGLNYIRSVLSLFETPDGEYSIYNFSKLEHDNFEKIMVELNHEVQAKFETENCNYDGLIYLINGINNGISLKLTSDQISAIEYMIDAVVNRQMDYLAHIDGILLARSHLEISDLDELTGIKERYDNIIDKLETNEYVSETEEIVDAINYSRISNEKIVEILTYLLQYNSEIYLLKKENNPAQNNEVKEETVEVENNEIDLSKPFVIEEKTVDIPIYEEELETDFNELNIDKLDNQDSKAVEDSENIEETVEEETSLENTSVSEVSVNSDDTYEEQVELNDENELEETQDELMDFDLPEVDLEDEEALVDKDFEDLVGEDDYSYETYNPIETNSLTDEVEEVSAPIVEQDDLEAKLDDISLSEEVQEASREEAEKDSANIVSDEEIKNLFNEYKIKYDELDEESKSLLLKGNVEKYALILTLLRNKEVLEFVEKNLDLITKILLYSDEKVIENVLEIIEKKLSVDKEDMRVTMNIMVSALPSVFVKEPNGNYETFIANVNSLKEWGIDLINLFDFSREVFVVNHEKMLNNYELVKTYNLTVDDKNAKYLLVLPNLAEKIDYYVEAVATDTMKNGTGKTFDGSEYIKYYPSKLNSVTDTTIKRLRYSSLNGKKIFGSKENSLAAEITNLKVDILNMDDEYLRSYFNNEYDDIERDEELRYAKLIQENNDYSLTLDETLESLNQYLDGLRYNIDGVNISRNKLVRNYNVLIRNGVNKTNALVFAACYNSVITKEEYQKVKNTLSNIGGR